MFDSVAESKIFSMPTNLLWSFFPVNIILLLIINFDKVEIYREI